MYYRVAFQVDPSARWQWKSTPLSSLNTLLQWLQYYRAFPKDRLRVFSASSRGELNEQLEQQNQGLPSTSLPAAQFLSERMILPSTVRSTAAREGATSLERGSIVVISQQAVNERDGEASALENRGMSVLQRRREERESGPGGDHDLPYHFALPRSMPQVLAWMRLMGRVQRGEVEP